MIHAERRGRPHSDRLDWGIVALDGLGLLLFFVPGVIAFAVDFATGAIYLPLEPSYPVYEINPQQPPAGSAQQVPSPNAVILKPADLPLAAREPSVWHRLGLRRILAPREELQPQRIEQIVTHYVGRQVSLDDNQARVSVLPCMERFDQQANRHRSDRNFGFAVRSFFERLKQRTAERS